MATSQVLCGKPRTLASRGGCSEVCVVGGAVLDVDTARSGDARVGTSPWMVVRGLVASWAEILWGSGGRPVAIVERFLWRCWLNLLLAKRGAPTARQPAPCGLDPRGNRQMNTDGRRLPTDARDAEALNRKRAPGLKPAVETPSAVSRLRLTGCYNLTRLPGEQRRCKRV